MGAGSKAGTFCALPRAGAAPGGGKVPFLRKKECPGERGLLSGAVGFGVFGYSNLKLFLFIGRETT